MANVAFEVEAGTASETTTGVDNGVDVDFVLTLSGREIVGEVTLLPHEDGRRGYGAWGQPEHWVSGNVLNELYELVRADALSHEDFRAVLNAIEAACAAEAAS